MFVLNDVHPSIHPDVMNNDMKYFK